MLSLISFTELHDYFPEGINWIQKREKDYKYSYMRLIIIKIPEVQPNIIIILI